MKLSQIVTTEGLREDLDDSGDHEYRGDFHSAVEATENETELEQDLTSIDSLCTGIDDATAGVDKIEEIQSNLSEGSVSNLEMISAQAAHRSIMNSLGIDQTLATLESIAHGDKGAALIATLEASKQNLLQKLVTGFKHAMDTIVAFVQNVFRNSWALQKYIDHVKKKVAALGNGKPSVATMKESARAMSADGTADMKSAELMNTTAEQLLSASLRAADEINKVQFKFSEKIDNRLDSQLTLNTITTRKNERGHVGYLTGDRTIVLTSQFTFGGISSPIKEIVTVGTPAQEISVASVSEMNTLLKYASSILTGIKEIDGKKQYLKNAASRVAQFVAQLGGTYAGVVSKTASDFEGNLAEIRTFRIFMQAIVGRLPLEAFKTAKAFIDYANHSTKHYAQVK